MKNKLLTMLLMIAVGNLMYPQRIEAQFCMIRVNALAALTGTLDVGMDVSLTDN